MLKILKSCKVFFNFDGPRLLAAAVPLLHFSLSHPANSDRSLSTRNSGSRFERILRDFLVEWMSALSVKKTERRITQCAVDLLSKTHAEQRIRVANPQSISLTTSFVVHEGSLSHLTSGT